MKKLIAAMCFMLAASPLAMAQERSKEAMRKAAPAAEKSARQAPSAKQKAQQDRMAGCNKQAGDKGMKGDARKKFMSGCLKG